MKVYKQEIYSLELMLFQYIEKLFYTKRVEYRIVSWPIFAFSCGMMVGLFKYTYLTFAINPVKKKNQVVSSQGSGKAMVLCLFVKSVL